MTSRHMSLLWLLALVAGATFLFIKVGVATIPPLTFVFCRLAIAAALLAAVLRAQRLRLPRERRIWLGLGFVGLINAALPYALFALGTRQIGANASGLASIYNATSPLWTVVFAQAFVPAERLPPLRTFGVALGFAGVVFLFARSIGAIGSADTAGQLICLAGAACTGVGPLYVRRRLADVAAPVLAFGQMATGALWLLPAAIAVEHARWQAPSPASLGALLGLAILGTALTQTLYFALVKQVGATRTAQVSYLIPLFALGWGWLVLGEPLRADMLIGLGVVFLGMLVINRRQRPAGRLGPASAGLTGESNA